MMLSDDKITIKGPNYNILDECSFDDAVFLSIGLGRLFKNSLLRKLMKNSESIGLESDGDGMVIPESGSLYIDSDSIESGTDDLGMIFVKKDGSSLYEGTLNDSAVLFMLLCDMFGVRTVRKLLTDPDEVGVIRINEKYLS